MTDSYLINTLARDKNWEELEKVFSSITSLGEDCDGNPSCIMFFKENITEAIILGEKYNLISSLDIGFLIRYSSSIFRKDLIHKLLYNNTIKPKEFFNKSEYCITVYQPYFLEIITQYRIDNNQEKIFDIDFIEMIFSNKDIEKNIDFNFILNNSTVECSFYFFNNLCMKLNFNNIYLIINYWKKNIDEVSTFDFNKKVFIGLETLQKKYKHPFSSKLLKEDIFKILESFHNVKLFINLQNTTFREKRIHINKI